MFTGADPASECPTAQEKAAQLRIADMTVTALLSDLKHNVGGSITFNVMYWN